jgi:antitoxin component YwqK of YwqJK toxin-antitoxin module
MAGQLHGDNLGYHPNGAVKHRFKYHEGKRLGNGFIYYDNNQIKTKESVALNGKNRTVEEFTREGLKISEKEYLDETPQGKWTLYHVDGKTVKERLLYDKGKLHGQHVEYFTNGKKEREDEYRFGLLIGPFKTYYENGALQSEGEYKSNRLHGLFKAYHANGKVKEEGEYIAARKHKEWKEYDEQGNLLRTFNFKAGILVETQEK